MNLVAGSTVGPISISIPDGMSFIGEGRWLKMSASMDVTLGWFFNRKRVYHFYPDESLRERPNKIVKAFALYKTKCRNVKIDLSHNGYTYVVTVSRRWFGAFRLFSVGIEYVADTYGSPYKEGQM